MTQRTIRETPSATSFMNSRVRSDPQVFIANPKREENGIKQNADVISIGDGSDRIGHDIGQQGVEDITQSLRSDGGFFHRRQSDFQREHLTGKYRQHGRQEGRQHIQSDNGAKPGIQAGRFLRQGTGDQNKDQNRSDSFQGTHKQVAKFANPAPSRNDQGENDANHQTDHDTQNQRGSVIATGEGFQKSSKVFHYSLSLFLSFTSVLMFRLYERIYARFLKDRRHSSQKRDENKNTPEAYFRSNQ